MAVRIVNVVFCSRYRELVIDTKDFNVTESLVFVKFLLQLLLFKMLTEACHDDHILAAFQNARVRLRLEGALLHLFILSNLPFREYQLPLVLFLILDLFLVTGKLTVFTNDVDDAWDIFVKLCVLGGHLWLEGQVFIAIFLVLDGPFLELPLCIWVGTDNTIKRLIQSQVIRHGTRVLVDLRREGHLAIQLLLEHRTIRFFLIC